MSHIVGPENRVISGRAYSTGMRSGRFFVLPPSAEPQTTSLGIEVAKTFTIHESEPIDGTCHYELLVDGELVWDGMGSDRADALLEAILSITGQSDDLPDN